MAFVESLVSTSITNCIFPPENLKHFCNIFSSNLQSNKTFRVQNSVFINDIASVCETECFWKFLVPGRPCILTSYPKKCSSILYARRYLFSLFGKSPRLISSAFSICARKILKVATLVCNSGSSTAISTHLEGTRSKEGWANASCLHYFVWKKTIK